MENEKTNRNKWIHVRLTATEFAHITNACKQTTCQCLSAYARKKLMDQPITVYVRDRSIDELTAQIILIRSGLTAIGHNYNQVVRKLHSLKDVTHLQPWLIIHERMSSTLIRKIEETKNDITTLFEKWSQ